MKPVLKAPGAMLLKLRYDEPLSNLAFNFNLRRYITVNVSFPSYKRADHLFAIATVDITVGRCRLTLSIPR